MRAREGLTADGLTHSADDDAPDIVDPTERGELLTEEQLDRSVLAEFDSQLAELDAAAERVAAGTFGRCETCGRPIGDERLEAIVWARSCVAHSGT